MKRVTYKTELRVIFAGQTPAQYAACFGFELVPPQAWFPEVMRAAYALFEQGVDPNRIGLFKVPQS